jgi:hypothetical protein
MCRRRNSNDAFRLEVPEAGPAVPKMPTLLDGAERAGKPLLRREPWTRQGLLRESLNPGPELENTIGEQSRHQAAIASKHHDLVVLFIWTAPTSLRGIAPALLWRAPKAAPPQAQQQPQAQAEQPQLTFSPWTCAGTGKPQSRCHRPYWYPSSARVETANHDHSHRPGADCRPNSIGTCK